MKKLFSFLLITCSGLTLMAHAPAKDKEVYEIKLYHYKTPAQEKLLDDYLSQSLLPALHKNGITGIGVFKPLANDTAADKTLYVFIPFKSFARWQAFATGQFAAAAPGTAYSDAPYNAPAYTRMESILLEAFPLALQMQLPALKTAHEDHIYELRSYESATEKLNANKVQMFNAGGEIALFKRLGFNGIFYAEVISGSHMPNLMYMTCFENRAARDEHWKTFGDDAEWKKLKALPEYQNNVSHADVVLCHATPYSDL